MAAAVASLVVSVPRVSRVRAARRAPAPARPTLAMLGARPQRASQRRVAAAAKLGGEDEEGGNVKITRDREPEEYWKSEGERAGKSPLQDPMAIASLLGLIVPFTILAIGIATGYIETH